MPDKNYFEELEDINVTAFVEQKNGLNYLSWAYAWKVLKERYPDATFRVYETADGQNYFHDGRTAWVKVGVTVNGIEHVEQLPVMNNRNQAIQLEQVDSFVVNKSIKRCLAKATALHGLGILLYTGEDLPAVEIICEKCGGAVEGRGKLTAQQFSDGTKKAYGKVLCNDCAVEAKEAKEAKKVKQTDDKEND